MQKTVEAEREQEGKTLEISREEFEAATRRTNERMQAHAEKVGDPKRGAEAVRNLVPVVFRAELAAGADPEQPNALFSPIVEIRAVVNPVLDDLLVALGYSRLSERSYRTGVGEDTDERIIIATLQGLAPEGLCCSSLIEQAHREGYGRDHSGTSVWTICKDIQDSAAGRRLAYSQINTAISNTRPYDEWKLAQKAALVQVSCNGKQLFVKVCTGGPDADELDGRRGRLYLIPDGPDFNLLTPDDERRPVRLSIAEALAALDVAERAGFPVIVEDEVRQLEQELGERFIALRVPGSPGLGKLVLPSERLGELPKKARDKARPLAREEYGEDARFHVLTEEAEAIHKLSTSVGERGTGIAMDPRIADVVAMAAAKPTGKRERLRPFQDECVSLHKATAYGYVDACEPGLGKTVITLQAMRERAAEREAYRGLICVQASLRSQWASEVSEWFPEAEVLVYQGKQIASLGDDLAAVGAKPATVIVSFDTLREGIDHLLAHRWHDLVGDELHKVLPNTASKRTKALWRLRHASEVAVALTGTPINKSLDDVGRLLAWARNEEDAFHGQRLSKRFDLTKSPDVAEFWRHIGPCVFRRDRSEIADQLPRISTEVIKIDLEPAELRLAEAARRGLKKLYEKLLHKLEVIEQIRPDDPKIRQAREEVRKVRGAVLGGITVARQAATDPETVRQSNSAGVALLDSAGLIDPAVRVGGTKRKLIAQLTEDLVGQGEAVLIFTSFSSVAKNLADDLRRMGIRVGTFTGENSGAAREREVAAYQNGERDVLILTSAGREGLNLQRTSVVILLDLDWEPASVVQKIARAARFGSKAETLQVLIPISAGTIEERVAAVLLPRAADAIAALDKARGVKAEDTQMGMALKGLGEAVPDSEKGDLSKFDMAAAILED